eukprot:SAG11_NODE_141_length_14934_cov_4.821503_4_plen_46_part_00
MDYSIIVGIQSAKYECVHKHKHKHNHAWKTAFSYGLNLCRLLNTY